MFVFPDLYDYTLLLYKEINNLQYISFLTNLNLLVQAMTISLHIPNKHKESCSEIFVKGISIYALITKFSQEALLIIFLCQLW